MGSSTMDSSEKNEVHVERVPNAVTDNAVLGKILPAAGLPAEFAHLDEKKILRKVSHDEPFEQRRLIYQRLMATRWTCD